MLLFLGTAGCYMADFLSKNEGKEILKFTWFVQVRNREQL